MAQPENIYYIYVLYIYICRDIYIKINLTIKLYHNPPHQIKNHIRRFSINFKVMLPLWYIMVF